MGRMDRVSDPLRRVGPIPSAVNQGIYVQSSTALARLGQRLQLGDRTFFYTYNGGVELAPGKLVGSPVVATEKETNMVQAEAIGSKQVDMVAVGTITADQYAEGYLSVVNDTGEGQTYKIKGNTAAAASATCTVYLYDGLTIALDITSDVIITPSIYRGAIICPDQALFVLGVPLITVTINYYFWLQTWGPCTVLCGDSTGNVTKERVCFSGAATGEFLTTTGGPVGDQTVGYVIYDSTDMVDTEYHLMYLTISP